jgi:protein-disulfide isomerase
MRSFFRVLAALFLISAPAWADDPMAERVLGKPDAPVRIDEYVSLTCTHCADFYNNVLPALETKYVESGKVKFVMHDFPIDGVSLKAAAVARCMPADEFFPFVKILFKNQTQWAFGQGNAETNMIQYAKLGGLSEEKARSCANDTKLQDAIVAERTEAGTKYNVSATPTFVMNNGAAIIQGTQPLTSFTTQIDQLLAAKK